MIKQILVISLLQFLFINSKASDSFRLTQEQAAEEIKIVVDNILRYHPNPFHRVSKEDFYNEVDRLLKIEEPISIENQYFNIARLSSMIFDTHTQLYPTNDTPGFKNSFPLRFKLFPDGLYIIAGNKTYLDHIGKKVISIGEYEPLRLIDSLSFYSPADNLPRKRIYTEMFLYMPETYEAFNLKNSNGKIVIKLLDDKGDISEFFLEETWNTGLPDFSWDLLNPFIPKGLISIHEKLKIKPPLFLQNMDKKYWFSFLDKDKKYFYIQINQQGDQDGYHSLDFHLDWSKALLNSQAEVVIIDLRNDPGGMVNVGSGLSRFLESYLYSYPKSKLKGVAVLLGYDTVSAGTILAAEIENWVWPIFIGEPSGSSPNMYLNAHKIILPYSKFNFAVSQTRLVSINENDPRNYIAPDVPMSISFEDYINGKDPLIEYAKSISEDVQSEVYEGAELNAIWKRKSQQEAMDE